MWSIMLQNSNTQHFIVTQHTDILNLNSSTFQFECLSTALVSPTSQFQHDAIHDYFKCTFHENSSNSTSKMKGGSKVYKFCVAYGTYIIQQIIDIVPAKLIHIWFFVIVPFLSAYNRESVFTIFSSIDGAKVCAPHVFISHTLTSILTNLMWNCTRKVCAIVLSSWNTLFRNHSPLENSPNFWYTVA